MKIEVSSLNWLHNKVALYISTNAAMVLVDTGPVIVHFSKLNICRKHQHQICFVLLEVRHMIWESDILR